MNTVISQSGTSPTIQNNPMGGGGQGQEISPELKNLFSQLLSQEMNGSLLIEQLAKISGSNGLNEDNLKQLEELLENLNELLEGGQIDIQSLVNPSQTPKLNEISHEMKNFLETVKEVTQKINQLLSQNEKNINSNQGEWNNPKNFIHHLKKLISEKDSLDPQNPKKIIHDFLQAMKKLEKTNMVSLELKEKMQNIISSDKFKTTSITLEQETGKNNEFSAIEVSNKPTKVFHYKHQNPLVINAGNHMGNIIINNTTPSAQTPLTGSVNISNFHQEMGDFMIQQMKITEGVGTSEALIKLFPENMGQVDVKIAFKDGQMTAQFITENLHAKEKIENQLTLLKNSLVDSGIDVQKIEVSQSSSSQNLFNDKGEGMLQQQRQQQQQQQHSSKRSSQENLEKEIKEIDDIIYGINQSTTGINYTA